MWFMAALAGCVPWHGLDPPGDTPATADTAPTDDSTVGATGTTASTGLDPAPELGFEDWVEATWIGQRDHAAAGMALEAMAPVPIVSPDDCTVPVLAVGTPHSKKDAGNRAEQVYVLYANNVPNPGGTFVSGMIAEELQLEGVGGDATNVPLRGGDYLGYAAIDDRRSVLIGHGQGNSNLKGKLRYQRLCEAPEAPSGDTAEPVCAADPGCTSVKQTVSPLRSGEEFGWAVEVAQGTQVFVGAPSNSDPLDAEASVYRLDAIAVALGTLDELGRWTAPAESAAGTALEAADFDGDERTDLAVGAPGTAGDPGAAFLIVDVVGRGSGTLAGAAAVQLTGGPGTVQLGIALHSAETDDQAGPDLWIADAQRWSLVSGATLAAEAAGGSGTAEVDLVADLVLEGWPSGPDPERATCEGITTPDLDNDGVLDLVVGGCWAEDGHGRAYVLFGPLGQGGLRGTHALDEVADVVLVGPHPDDRLGGALATLSYEQPYFADRLVIGAWGYGLVADEERGAVMIARRDFWEPYRP